MSEERPTSEVKITGDGNVVGDGSSALVVKAESGATIGSVTLIGKVVTQLLGRGIDEERAQRSRRAMLEMVGSFWVKGVLEQSLYGAAMIELGLEEQADAVERPWDIVLQTEREERTLPPGTRIIDVFDEVGGNLLILGAPGSGKTTMLLELARDTIARAGKDHTQPIPAVFNLSSWAEKRQPIAEWLVEELNTKYNVPKRVARPWVENDDLLLLLDGLDEVKREYREDCVRVINGFRQEHMVPLVVCSRAADYQALTTRLRLQGAVLLQPLTPQQVDEYLGRAGVALLAVRETLQHDPTLQELAETPLMLSVITLAYRGRSVEDLQTLETTAARRKHVFESYVQRMFERRGADQPYSPEQTTRWLAWLAWSMSQHGQTMLGLREMRYGWLLTDVQRRVFLLGFGLPVGLFVGLVAGMINLLTGEVLCIPTGLAAGMLCGWFLDVLLMGFLCYLFSDDLPPIWGSILGKKAGWPLIGLCIGLVAGLAVSSIAGSVHGFVAARQNRWIAGLSALLLGLAGIRLIIKLLVDTTAPCWLRPSEVPSNEIIGGSLGLARLAGAVGLALIGGMVGCIVDGFVGLAAGLAGGLVFGLLHELMWLGLDLMSVSSLSVIQQILFHLVFSSRGYIPWKYSRFLDYAAERIFLRKVGGGYIFIHRLLQDHFASLYQGQ